MVVAALSFAPAVYSVSGQTEWEQLIERLRKEAGEIKIYDSINQQLIELFKCRHPFKPFQENDFKVWLESRNIQEQKVSYGNWVFYPEEKELVHLLPEDEFVEVRTNRNQYKITPQEQRMLAGKKVGIVGLSVGQTVAITIAMERGAGEIRLADFDTIDLSNLNRLRSCVTEIGNNKTKVCAKEIWRLDPYIKLSLFQEGIHENNIDDFFLAGGKLDLLIEECDGLDIKILARHKAKKHGVPVLMETNDRCLIDIERFDLESNRPLLHGLIGDLDPYKLKGLSQEDKIEYLLPMVGLQSLSERMKASMIEVQSSINSWPQLASSVTMGGGVAAELSRKILLGESTVSGRYYVDLDQIIQEPIRPVNEGPEHRPPLLNQQQVMQMIKDAALPVKEDILSEPTKLRLAEAARMAPSGGNCQPWKFVFTNGYMYLFHEVHHSMSFLDFQHTGTYFAFGALIENVRIAAGAEGFRVNHAYFPDKHNPLLVAALWFTKDEVLYSQATVAAMLERHTNRNLGMAKPLTEEVKSFLNTTVAKHKPLHFVLVEETATMKALAEIISTGEKHLLLNPQGHKDIFERELRWNKEEVEKTRDGIDIATLNMSRAEILALKVAGSHRAMQWVDKIDGGEAFKKGTKKAIAASSAMGIVTMPVYSPEAFLAAGAMVEELWVNCQQSGIAFQPATQYAYLYARVKHGEGKGFTPNVIQKFKELQQQFESLVPEIKNRELAFLFRLSYAPKPQIPALRRTIENLLFGPK